MCNCIAITNHQPVRRISHSQAATAQAIKWNSFKWTAAAAEVEFLTNCGCHRLFQLYFHSLVVCRPSAFGVSSFGGQLKIRVLFAKCFWKVHTQLIIINGRLEKHCCAMRGISNILMGPPQKCSHSYSVEIMKKRHSRRRHRVYQLKLCVCTLNRVAKNIMNLFGVVALNESMKTKKKLIIKHWAREHQVRLICDAPHDGRATYAIRNYRNAFAHSWHFVWAPPKNEN